MRIKNAQICCKQFIVYKNSKFSRTFLNLLWNNGYILNYKIITFYNLLKIELKFLKNKPLIYFIKIFNYYQIQKFYSIKQIFKLFLNVNQILIIVHTKFGIKTLLECRKKKLGGRLLLAIF